MATKIRPEDVRKPHTRYERRTADVRLIAFTRIAFVVIAVLIHLGVLGLFNSFKGHYAARDTNPSPIQTAEPHRLPPEPRLQPDPEGDIHKLRQQEDDILQTYGIDRATGAVRLP